MPPSNKVRTHQPLARLRAAQEAQLVGVKQAIEKPEMFLPAEKRRRLGNFVLLCDLELGYSGREFTNDSELSDAIQAKVTDGCMRAGLSNAEDWGVMLTTARQLRLIRSLSHIPPGCPEVIERNRNKRLYSRELNEEQLCMQALAFLPKD